MRSHSLVSRFAVTAILNCILLSAAACKKSEPAVDPASVTVPVGAPVLDLASSPQLLFQVFGDGTTPHMMPIAAVVKNAIKPIGLTPGGWKALQKQYFAAGTKYPFYVEGAAPGELTVTHDTTFALPGCKIVKPMAAISLAFKTPRADPTVEFLASSIPLATRPVDGRVMMTSADIAKLARRIGHELGKRGNLSAAALDSLNFHARVIPTGTGKAPTLLISFIDPNAGEAKSGSWTGHIFALADSGASGYAPTYQHVVKGDARNVEFQRLVNHVDIDGDGIDEIIVEAWKFGSDNDLVVLSFKAGVWQEVLRVKQDWCLDLGKAK